MGKGAEEFPEYHQWTRPTGLKNKNRFMTLRGRTLLTGNTRPEYFLRGPKFFGKNLRGPKFFGKDLRGLKFFGKNLRGLKLFSKNLRGLKFYAAKI